MIVHKAMAKEAMFWVRREGTLKFTSWRDGESSLPLIDYEGKIDQWQVDYQLKT